MTCTSDVIHSWSFFWHMDCMKFYTMCWWLLGWFLFETLSLYLLSPPPRPPASPHCIHHSQTHAIRQTPEHNWALNNPGFHPISSEPPLSNTICKGMHYRMAKMERILPTFTLLSLHLKGQLWIPVKKNFHVIKWWLCVYIVPLAVPLILVAMETKMIKNKGKKVLK